MASYDATIWALWQDFLLLLVLREFKDAGYQSDNGGFRMDAFNEVAARIAAR